MGGPLVIDAEPSWEAQAVRQLRLQGYARLRLTPDEARLTRDLYDAASDFFSDEAAMRSLEVDDEQWRQYDSRSGYVADRKRQTFELHSSAEHLPRRLARDASGQSRFMRCTWAFNDMCDARCERALVELAASDPSSPLSRLVACERRGATRPAASEAEASEEGAPSQPSRSKSPMWFASSMLRVYRYNKEYAARDGDAHRDMGVVTFIPRSSWPGLEIQPMALAAAHAGFPGPRPGEWLRIEKVRRHPPPPAPHTPAPSPARPRPPPSAPLPRS